MRTSCACFRHDAAVPLTLPQLAVFCISWRAYPTVTARMEQSWKPCAEHWAWWGRTAVLDLCANTNNGTER